MTLEQILKAPADSLESMTDAQLEEWAKQFWPVCKPSMIPKKEKSNTPLKQQDNQRKKERLDNLFAIAESLIKAHDKPNNNPT